MSMKAGHCWHTIAVLHLRLRHTDIAGFIKSGNSNAIGVFV